MISVQEAEAVIKAQWLPPRTESIPIAKCAGRVLAEPIYADRDYPPINRVMVDGIAINYAAYAAGQRRFRVAGMAAAGVSAATLADPQQCFEVMTGCPLPLGSDLVVPYEQIHIERGVATITYEVERSRGDFIHRQGSDCIAGALVLHPGITLKSVHIGILASFGYSHVQVEAAPRVKLVATGDELVSIERTPTPYQLRCSNAYALRAALLAYGYTEVEIDHIPDDSASIIAHYQTNTQSYDLLIYTGGISKGKRDYLPRIWQHCGVTGYIHGVAQKPGKPMWFGIDHQANTIVWGLPGNPVSALVCLHRYLLNRTVYSGYLGETITFEPNLTFFVPAKLGSNQALTLIMPQSSGDFVALATSDGFVELPQDQVVFKAGEVFLFYPWY
ncbi:molybdopterin molybdotransferase MoeA [Synechococcus sp. OH20]|uniref:molybdopterin molybdotransferase MoeA n=1 Tax=Synechococcus sp. OH20 TaxID=139337 RepID=UPI0039C73AA8